MAYGDNRVPVASDTFDSSISASWTAGEGAWDNIVWATGGHFAPSNPGAGFGSTLRRNTGTFADDGYSTITIQTLSASAHNQIGCIVRKQASTAGYYGFVSSNNIYGAQRYELFELDGSNGYTLLTASGTPGAFSAGQTVTLEAEGTTLRLGTNEGSGDTQRLTTTDATLTSGWPGIAAVADSSAAQCQGTAWEGGDISAGGGGGVVIPVMRHHYLVMKR